MTKNQKILIGLGVIAIGYFVWENNKSKKQNFSVANMKQKFSSPNLFGVPVKIKN